MIKTSKSKVDIQALEKGLLHLSKVLTSRIDTLLIKTPPQQEQRLNSIPVSTVHYFQRILKLDQVEATEFAIHPSYTYAILLALTPYLSPYLIDNCVQGKCDKPTNLSQLGGVRDSRGFFIPTVETLVCICGATKLSQRLEIYRLLENTSLLLRRQIIDLHPNVNSTSLVSTPLQLSTTARELLTRGSELPPQHSSKFPAKRVTTTLQFTDLVLPSHTTQQVLEIEDWIEYGNTLQQDQNLGKHLKKGYRVLFYGPPGTGKTITASVLGERNNMPVYVVDLSMIVSKYIGETEKNLAHLLDKAERQNWILFFDEADALYGKRTGVKEAQDRFANQEISFLLQRIEQYDGLVIMATNIKKNIDEAFLRRFQLLVHFPIPGIKERSLLWQKALPTTIPIDDSVLIDELAKKYKLSGANIINAMYYSSLQALKKQPKQRHLSHTDLLDGIRRELAKEGKGLGT